MSRSIFGMGAAVISTSLFFGCSAEDRSSPAANTANEAASAKSDEESEMNEAMEKLSPEDRALAEAQKVCPVSDEPLGSMGTPIKVTVDGKDVFVCCEGCVHELKNNFAKYADKLESKS